MCRPITADPLDSEQAPGLSAMQSASVGEELIPAGAEDAIRALLQTRTEPLFLLDFEGVRAAVTDFHAAWEKYFPTLQIAYSFKTNSTRAVTHLMKGMGLGAEVVSHAELKWALADGFSPRQVYFNGPFKSRDALHDAIAAGVNINVDSHEQLQAVLEAHHVAKKSPQIGLRLASTNRAGRRSRFGFTKSEYFRAVESLDSAQLALRGLQLHIGSNLNDPARYELAIREYLPLIRAVLGGMEWLSLGGGFPARTVGEDKVVTPIEAFSAVIAALFNAEQIELGDSRLLVEPGRCLVEDFGTHFAKIHSRKSRPKCEVLTANTSRDFIGTCGRWYHPIRFFRTTASACETTYDVYGFGCYEQDLLGESVQGPPDVEVGDWIMIGSVGAYDLATSRSWTTPAPDVYGWFGDGRLVLVRRGQEVAEMRERDADFGD